MEVHPKIAAQVRNKSQEYFVKIDRSVWFDLSRLSHEVKTSKISANRQSVLTIKQEIIKKKIIHQIVINFI